MTHKPKNKQASPKGKPSKPSKPAKKLRRGGPTRKTAKPRAGLSDWEKQVRANSKAQQGRPSYYTPELGAYIADRIALGETVKAIGADPAMPPTLTILRWAVDEDHPFYELYRNARRIRSETMAEELINIADQSTTKMVVDPSGVVRVDTGAVSAAKLQIDTRHRLASIWYSKLYGTKVEATIKGDGFIPLDQLMAAAKALPDDPEDD